jgi:hypothetical protein
VIVGVTVYAVTAVATAVVRAMLTLVEVVPLTVTVVEAGTTVTVTGIAA